MKHDTSQTSGRPTRLHDLLRRLAASLNDLIIIAGWVVFTALVGLGLRAIDWTPSTPAGWDLYAWCTLVAPTIVTFAYLDATRRSPGKRRFGLFVVGPNGSPLGFTRSLVRSTIKFAPWQLAHTAVFQLAAGNDDPLWFGLSITAQVWVLLSCLGVAITRRGLHDFVAGSQCIYKL